jgi:FkbM family methyltransferase
MVNARKYLGRLLPPTVKRLLRHGQLGSSRDLCSDRTRYHSVIPWRRHLFIDGGGYNGCSIRRFLKEFDREGRFEIVTFEPNDVFANCYADFPRHCLIRAAIHNRDGSQDFFLDPEDGDGSTFFRDKLTRETGGYGALDVANPVTVRTINLSRWIREHTKPFDYVILKLDVEGAEYDVLERMIRDRTIRRIKHLFVEWHWNRVGISQQRHEELLRALQRRRVAMLEWDALGY